MFDVEIDTSEVEAAWQDACGLLVAGCVDATTKGAREGLDEAKRSKQYKDRSGDLTRTARAYLLYRTGDEAVAVIEWPEKYASFVEDGTRPHLIEPKRSRGWLAWENPEAQGDWHFSKIVHHPGTSPHPFAGQAYLAAERVALREIEVSVASMQERMDR